MKKLSNQLLADTISAKRKEMNLTQARLSEFTGINRSMIGRIENLEYTPTINQLEKLAEVLDFDLTNLFVEGASDSTDSTPMKKRNIAVKRYPSADTRSFGVRAGRTNHQTAAKMTGLARTTPAIRDSFVCAPKASETSV